MSNELLEQGCEQLDLKSSSRPTVCSKKEISMKPSKYLRI